MHQDPKTLASPPISIDGQSRLHALDALRAVAMLLGVYLHAAAPYSADPGVRAMWPVSGGPLERWGLASEVGLALNTLASVAILLLSYWIFVRRTVIGRLLNGRRRA